MRRADFGGSFVSLFSLVRLIFGAIFGRLRHRWSHVLRAGVLVAVCGAFGLASLSAAVASPALVVDAATGDVLYAEEATQPWYPASLTKLMTFYLALSAVRDHKISLDTPIVISARAARAVPSKMGFKPGTEVTLGNALKMLIVKSPNDIAIAIAEGVAGSVEAFAEDMNAAAAKLGMEQSHFVNPNGLPDPEHVSSAHDLAILARAVYLAFPKEAGIFGIGALRLGDEIIPTHNTLLGRYPGADGMKTGFTCAAGFNLVASAQRSGHRYIAVVLGAPSVRLRMLKMAVLLDRAFDGIDHPQGKLEALEGGSPGAAPDMHNMICRHRAKTAAAFQAEITRLEAPLLAEAPAAAPAPLALFTGGAVLNRLAPVAPTIAMLPKPVFDPVPVYVGPAPGYQGPVAEARPPHSPVGTPPPPEAASANGPPKPDVAALQVKRRHMAHRHTARTKMAHHRTARLKGKTAAAPTPAVTADKASAKRQVLKRQHAVKLADTAASKPEKHQHKHAAIKGRTHKAKSSTKLAAKAHEAAGETGKSKPARPAAPDPQ